MTWVFMPPDHQIFPDFFRRPDGHENGRWPETSHRFANGQIHPSIKVHPQIHDSRKGESLDTGEGRWNGVVVD